jgi:hypothetical protein
VTVSLKLAAVGRRLAALALLVATPLAHAALNDAFKRIGQFEDAIVDRVSAVVSGGAMHYVATRLFFVLALALFVLKCTSWALRGFKLGEMVETAVQIMFTGLMLSMFTTVVPAIFNAALYVGAVLLAGIMGLGGGTAAAVATPTSLVDMLVTYGMQISPNCHLGWNPLNILDCVRGGAVQIVAALAISLLLAGLCVAVLLVDIWGFWLYGIALATGPVLLPFTLYRRLSFLFEGWLRFFFGAVIYLILARVNLALVVVALMTYWGSSAAALSGGGFTPPTLAPIDDVTQVLGLMLFAGVGIFTLLATGRFASAIVAGAAAGGINFGQMARTVTRWVTR